MACSCQRKAEISRHFSLKSQIRCGSGKCAGSDEKGSKRKKKSRADRSLTLPPPGFVRRRSSLSLSPVLPWDQTRPKIQRRGGKVEVSHDTDRRPYYYCTSVQGGSSSVILFLSLVFSAFPSFLRRPLTFLSLLGLRSKPTYYAEPSKKRFFPLSLSTLPPRYNSETWRHNRT